MKKTSFPKDYQTLLSQISPTDPVVVLTGAGISAPSGISTFRDNNGMWENHRFEEVASPDAFYKNPELVHRFYNLRRQQLKSVQPNEGHKALVKWEQNWQGPFLVVSQNVDDLHERAGTKKLISMHGQLTKIHCVCCQKKFHWTEDLETSTPCANCKSVDALRPDIVWFGEQPIGLDKIYTALDNAKIFVAIGTSGNVYPAAAFVRDASKAISFEINNQETLVSEDFDYTLQEGAQFGTPRLVEDILKLFR
jgi:NAD-dependent deacetylase